MGSVAYHYEAQPQRQYIRKTRYREWAEYGPPPMLPIRPPAASAVRQALLLRRVNPTQSNLLLHLLELAGTRSWCYFSTIGWMKALGVTSPQLLRARRALIEQHIIFYQPFPAEEAPYLDQPKNGWIGFYPPAEWYSCAKTWGGTREGAGRPKRPRDMQDTQAENQQQPRHDEMQPTGSQQPRDDEMQLADLPCPDRPILARDAEDQATTAQRQAAQAQAGNDPLFFCAANENQVDTERRQKQNQVDYDTSSSARSTAEPDMSSLSKEGSKQRKPVSCDTGAASAPSACEMPKTKQDKHEALPPVPSGEPSTSQQRTPLASDEGTAPPTAELQEASCRKETRVERVTPEQLALWREDVEAARDEERHAWRALREAENALAAAGHGWGSGRDGLLVKRQEASRVHWQTQLRREAYELLVSLVEQGVAKDDAIERTFEAYPYLCPDPAPADSSAPDEATEEASREETLADPTEMEEAMEAWSLLTEEQWRRALFGQFCRLWQWPTGKDLNQDARGRLNVAAKTLLNVRLRPEYVPLFVAWWRQQYPWRTNALPWELAASVNDFLLWQETNQMWNPS